MNPDRTLEILTKLKAIHEENPRLAMTDITNAEIIEALDIGAEAVRVLIAQELMKDKEIKIWQS